MKAGLIRIGNSRGVRLPKPLIEEARLKEEAQLRVRDGALVITSLARARSGWAEAARIIHKEDQDELLDEIDLDPTREPRLSRPLRSTEQRQ